MKKVPGEGEHKIMDFIRHHKAQPNYDPNTRHCLYGLDADLIMLALTTHEPHFALLREDVFKQKKTTPVDPTKTTFQLVHLSLLREFLDLEFRGVKPLNTSYNLERIIDDFVLLCFFVGNDFLPSLPHQDITDGSLNNMFDWYKEVIPNCQDYLCEGSVIHMDSLETFLAKIGEDERKRYEFIPQGANLAELLSEPNTSNSPTQDSNDHSTIDPEDTLKLKRLEADLHSIGVPLTVSQEVDEDTWKNSYYLSKFHRPITDQSFYEQLKKSYIEALCWVLNYYHNGCNSWSWFYPYHYAPLAADLKNISSYEIKFELGVPFHPFEQLLAVLPPASANLLPEPFRKLMLQPDSPIIDFYPPKIDYDLNGKKHRWEAIVLLDFIDQEKLLNAIKTIPIDSLTEEEKSLNEFGHSILYVDLGPSSKPQLCESPFTDKRLGNFYTTVVENPFSLPEYPSGTFQGFQLLSKTLIGKYSPFGFPTLEILNFQTHYEKVARVFRNLSKLIIF